MNNYIRFYLRCFLLVVASNFACDSRMALAWSDVTLGASYAIPPTVAAEARRLRIPFSAVKLLKGRWIACVRNDNNVETCLDLGSDSRVTVYAQSTQRTQDALPRYRRESPLLVRTADLRLVADYVDSHPDEPFLVLVTVPSLCEPCRRMDQTIRQTHASSSSAHVNVKTFILEYQSFEEAKTRVLGDGALFPTTLAFGPGASPRSAPTLVIGNATGTYIELLSSKLSGVFKRGVPNAVARGFLSTESIEHLAASVAQPRTR